MPQPTILILTAVRFEAKAIASVLGLRRVLDHRWTSTNEGIGIELQTIGIRAVRLPPKADWPNLRCIILAGLAGALDPQLAVGDVVIDGGAAKSTFGVTAHFGTIHCADQIIASPAHKALLHAQTGALAVDMESRVVRDWAAMHGVQFISIRAISDAAHQSLDPALPQLIDEFGAPRPWAMVKGFLRRPARIPALIRLGQDSHVAVSQLAAAVRQLIGYFSNDLQAHQAPTTTGTSNSVGDAFPQSPT